MKPEQRIQKLEAEVERLKDFVRGIQLVQNPLWFGVVIKDTVACSDFETGHKIGKAELFIPDRAGATNDLKASGVVRQFIIRFNEIYYRGQLMLLSGDWNDSVSIMPACAADFEDKLTVDEDGLPLTEAPPPPP